jgi:hypothetical protein
MVFVLCSVLCKKHIMKKSILVAVAAFAASAALAQKKEKLHPPPPPPPAIVNVKDVPPAPPPPPKIKVEKFVSPDNADYQAFLKRNPTVKRIGWSKNKVRIHLKSGKEEVYDMNKEEEVKNLKDKYGELPAPPPPPPPPPAPKVPKITQS